jgi:GNAT superfamily N-acetyltransferase
MTTNPSTLIYHAESDHEILRCLPVLLELRPFLTRETFLSTIRRMKTGGYCLVMVEAVRKVVAVAGYRFSEHLARGKFLYIDDFVTAADVQRSGHGQKLFEWLAKTAKDADCEEMHLDSGVQRADAHLFYEKQKMHFSSRHYALKLNPA